MVVFRQLSTLVPMFKPVTKENVNMRRLEWARSTKTTFFDIPSRSRTQRGTQDIPSSFRSGYQIALKHSTRQNTFDHADNGSEQIQR